MRTDAAHLVMAMAHNAERVGVAPVEATLAAKLSQLALAANASAGALEESNDKERLHRIQVAKQRPREARLTADDVQRLRDVCAEAQQARRGGAGGAAELDADVARPLAAFLAKRDEDAHLREYAAYARQLEAAARQRRAQEAADAVRVCALLRKGLENSKC